MSRKRPFLISSAPTYSAYTDSKATVKSLTTDTTRPTKRYLNAALAAELDSLRISQSTGLQTPNVSVPNSNSLQQQNPFGAKLPAASPFLSPSPTSTFATNFTPHSAFSFSAPPPASSTSSSTPRHIYHDFATALPDPGPDCCSKRQHPSSSSSQDQSKHNSFSDAIPLPNSYSSSTMGLRRHGEDVDDNDDVETSYARQKRRVKRRRTFPNSVNSNNNVNSCFQTSAPPSSLTSFNTSNTLFENDVLIEETDEPVTENETRVVVYNPSGNICSSKSSSSSSPSSSSTCLISPLKNRSSLSFRSNINNAKGKTNSLNDIFCFGTNEFMPTIPFEVSTKIGSNDGNSLAVMPYFPSTSTKLTELVQRPDRVIQMPWTDNKSALSNLTATASPQNENELLNQSMEIEEIG